MEAEYHVGRSWTGTFIEDTCPCEKGPCGLVAKRDPKCEQHGFGKTIRQGHPASLCPAKESTDGGA